MSRRPVRCAASPFMRSTRTGGSGNIAAVPVPTGDEPGREVGMMEAFCNLLLLVVYVAILILWIAALVDSDGKCHLEDCTGCPYLHDCQEERRRKDEDC